MSLSPHAVTHRPASAKQSRRAVWIALSVWTGLCSLLHGAAAGYSWHYFLLGARLLTGSAGAGTGLHLYAAHPELQIGPLALAIAVPFSWAGPTFGLLLAAMALTALGLLALRVLVTAAERTAPISDSLLLLTGICLMPVWAELATHFTHLDDGLTLGFAVLALSAVASDRPLMVGLCLAAAIGCKPWAIAFAPLLLALAPQQRRRAALLTLLGVLAVWLPFLVGDPGTAALGHFSIVNAADSGLRALGVNSARTPPWDRAAQAVLGVTVAAVVVRRKRWPAVLLAGIAARMLLDPQTYPYYTAGLVLAAAAVDILRPQRQLPLWTTAAFGFYLVTTAGKLVLPAGALGDVRFAFLATILGLLCIPGPQARGPHPPARGPSDASWSQAEYAEVFPQPPALRIVAASRIA